MIKNTKSGNSLLENIETLNEAAVQLYKMISEKDNSVMEFAGTMFQLISMMQLPLDKLHEEEPALMSQLICKNVSYSLQNLILKAVTSPGTACRKIQFELLPLINELYTDLYCWGFCYPDKEKIWHYYKNEMNDLCPLPVSENGEYKYEVSVVVPAYNKLGYTKKCLEYFNKYFPKDLNYELILYNNGSSDGTKEFFESLNPDKQIDLKYNTKSWSIISRVVEGKYILTVSNDVLILPNSVENLLNCIKSDESIACVMSTCPNIANFETIPAEYSNEQEMVEFALKNNVSDPSRWEQRTRLNPPLLLGKSCSEAVSTFYTYQYPFHPVRFLAFTDDLMGMIARRKKQKCMLAKDSYVHHFGSVTIKENTHQNESAGGEFYLKIRKEFFRIFEIDPWGIEFCFDYELISKLNYSITSHVNILGINCGMGDSLLKIKAMLNEKAHNIDVQIFSVTDSKMYAKDLNGISDEFKFVENINDVKDVFAGKRFSFIIIDDINEKCFSEKTLHKMFLRLTVGGSLAVKNKNIQLKSDRCSKKDETSMWQIFYKK